MLDEIKEKLPPKYNKKRYIFFPKMPPPSVLSSYEFTQILEGSV